MEKFTGLIGIMVLLGIAYTLSNNRSMIKPRIVIWGLGLQILFGIIIAGILANKLKLSEYLNKSKI